MYRMIQLMQYIVYTHLVDVCTKIIINNNCTNMYNEIKTYTLYVCTCSL